MGARPKTTRSTPRKSPCCSAAAPRAWRIPERGHSRGVEGARGRQQTEDCKPIYARRAGIEGTLAQGTRTGDLRRSRYMGLVKTRLRPLRLASAINFRRVAAWFADIP